MPVKHISEKIQSVDQLPSGLTLFSGPSPNVQKLTLYLELLNVNYNFRVINRVALEQKEEWFIELNPQGKFPLLIDNRIDESKKLIISESNSILLYIANNYDQEYKYFKPESLDKQLYYQELKYLFLQEGALRLTQFQWKWYVEHQKDKTEEIDRFKNETLIVHDVIERQLRVNKTGYLIDKGLNIVDIAIFPFLKRSKYLLNLDLGNLFPLSNELLERVLQLNETKISIEIPSPAL
ncbi:hypothetical protein WICMUC_000455 [Wickerhamomyces mucosus]|uniref:GST N-terminal domain-containing protein n=1 Tax=Wickerhamomyces mucosus TaxID=1378264 RepID=A0A9P8PXR7_9ASCO|nr:hypothetical protein WICMUC_000455 [Wickerhamomyces mucosus]